MNIREALQTRPWLGWTLAGALLLVAIFLLLRPPGAGNPYTFDRLTQDITIRDRESGEEWTIKRGRMEQILWDRGGKLDSNVGLPNPKTGTLTGFPKSDWEATIERIKQDRQAAIDAYGGHVPTSTTTRRASAPK